MSAPEIRILTEGTELADEAADLFVWFGQQAITARGCFRVALSGGSTPKALYAALTRPPISSQLDWARVQFFFGDERCVAPDHPESNYALADQFLFRPLKLPEAGIFRVDTQAAPTVADTYEAILRKQFDAAPPAWPRFHLILLGMGEDGHTASLFPGSPALQERTRLVVPSTAPKGIAQRITFTFPLINQAEAVMFVVTGDGKASPVRAVLEPQKGATVACPAGSVNPTAGRLIWMLDEAAASQLAFAKQRLVSHEE